MFINSRFKDYYDFELNMSFDKQDTMYKRDFCTQTLKSNHFLLGIGDLVVKLEYTKDIFYENIRYFNKEYYDKIGTFSIAEDIRYKSDCTISATKSSGALVISEPMKKYLEWDKLEKTLVKRPEGILEPVFILFKDEAYCNFSFMTSGIDISKIINKTYLEISVLIENYISSQNDTTYKEFSDSLKIQSKGFDLKTSFRNI